jgi:hypothetical protein
MEREHVLSHLNSHIPFPKEAVGFLRPTGFTKFFYNLNDMREKDQYRSMLLLDSPLTGP